MTVWYVLTHDVAHGAALATGTVISLGALKWRAYYRRRDPSGRLGPLRAPAITVHAIVLRFRPRARVMIDGLEVTSQQANLMRSRAKMNFQMGKYDLAFAQARTAMLLFGCLSADDPGWDALCASFGELMLQFGRPEACDRLMQLSIEYSNVRGNELGCRELFYAKFLFDQRRLAEAEHHALEAIRAPFGEVGFAHELLAEIRGAAAPRRRR